LAIYKCRSRFSGSANYTQIMSTFCAPAQPRGLGPFPVVAGPALWSDLSRQCSLSKSITTGFTARRCYHVSCILSAPWRRCIATNPPTSTLATTSCCFTSRFGMAVSQNTLCVFSAQDGHGKKSQRAARGASLLPFSVVKFWSIPCLIHFEKPPCLTTKARVDTQEGSRPKPRSEFKSARASI